MRLVFCGTPQFAVPTLEAILDAGHTVELALTQPDRPSGRGMEMQPPPVKRLALSRGLAVDQPEKLRNNVELRRRLEGIAPEAIVVVAYGRLIPPWMLALPRLGTLNVHGSLLPRYRGAAPIQWAVANGETETGVTTMRIDEGMDTGEILLQARVPIGRDQTAEDLFPVLAATGARLMIETLDGLRDGSLTGRPQDHAQATLAPLLQREDGRIDWRRAAAEIYNRWRGFQPWPGAFTGFRGKKLTICRMRIPESAPQVPASDAPPGTMHRAGARMLAACGGGTWVELLEVQMEGKRRMPVEAFLNGFPPQPGERLE